MKMNVTHTETGSDVDEGSSAQLHAATSHAPREQE